MTTGHGSKGIPPMFTDDSLIWLDEHATEWRQYASGQGLLHWSLVISFVVGLAAQVGGYALQSSLSTGTLGLLADLLHALGWSLWTGAILAMFVQVIPEVKRRQINQYLDAYEAFRRDRAQNARNPRGAV